MCLRIPGINYPQHDSDRTLLASKHLVVILHLTVGDFIALCCPTKSNTNSTLSYFAWFSQWNRVCVLFFLEYWQFNNYLTATNVQQNSRTLQIWIKRMGHLPPTHSCTTHIHSVGVLHINGFPVVGKSFDSLPLSGCLSGKLLDIYWEMLKWDSVLGEEEKSPGNQKDSWGDISVIILIILCIANKKVPIFKLFLKCALRKVP